MRRRSVLAAIGGLTAGGVAGCLSTTPRDTSSQSESTASRTEHIPQGRWPQVAYDAQKTAHVPEARGPRDDATIAWTSFGNRPVYPPVVDDRLYLTEGWTEGRAFEVASNDGKIGWENTDLPPMRWAPALHENRLLVVTREEGNVVRLHALDTETGDQEWVRERGITASSGERPPTGPSVRGGIVYLGSDRGVIACDAASGEVEWEATLAEHVIETEDGPTWRTDWATPAVTADRVFTFDMNESYQAIRTIYAVERATGDQEWTADLTLADGWSLKGHAVAGDDHVFVSALDPHMSMGFDDRDWSGTERLFALDARTGDVDWDWELPRKTLTPPAYADGTLYVGEWYPDADTGRLHALNAGDGSITWTYETDTGAIRYPTVADDTIYIAQGKELAAITTNEETPRWRLQIDSHTGPPIVVGETIYSHTNPGHNDDSRLLAIQEPNR